MTKINIVRNTKCRTKRQVNKFLFKHNVIMKNGVLYRVPSMIVVYGYVERLQSGAYSICISAK